MVLDAWIAQDTLHPTEEAVRADPDDYYARVINMTHLDGDSERTPAEKLEYALRFRHVVYLTSAIDHRGVLALATRTDGAWFADRVSRFLRDHRARRAQSEALLRVASAHPSEEALQLLLGVARRYRQKTIQALALELITDLADRRGWTPLQLADRTVPYAGLDDQGRLVLDFGPRQFVAEVSDALTLSLYDRDPSAPGGIGAARKALPDPTDADDAQLASEAKKDFAAARSGLKKIVAAQRARLYDAMIVQQRWPAGDWQELFTHPVLRRLAAQYVWAAHRSDGDIRLLRPDGTETFEDGVQLTIAHAAVIDSSLLESWRTPKGQLPQQLAVPAVDLADPMRDGADALEDFSGWIIQATQLRRLATKRGYQRGDAEDGGIVFCYTKHFEQAQVRAEIDFTGTPVGQRDGTVSLLGVRFVRATVQDAPGGAPLPLAEVPAVLTAEVYADYAAIAEKGIPDSGNLTEPT